ncbi:MAG: helix-turn-helix transcriptional regulator [Actinomycetota bacterium]
MRIQLTVGERRIAERVAEGRRNDEIATDFGISRRTVEWHLTNIYRKLRVRNRTELVLRTASQRRRKEVKP